MTNGIDRTINSFNFASFKRFFSFELFWPTLVRRNHWQSRTARKLGLYRTGNIKSNGAFFNYISQVKINQEQNKPILRLKFYFNFEVKIFLGQCPSFGYNLKNKSDLFVEMEIC